MVDIPSLLAGVDLPTLIGTYTDIKRHGGEWVATCCFHTPDKKPSLTVFKKDNSWVYYCHSCKAGGDAIKFIQEMDGVSFQDACKKLNGSDWPGLTAAQQQPELIRQTYLPPLGAPEPKFILPSLGGAPLFTWTYRDIYGNPIGYVCRYADKEFRPWSWGNIDGEAPGWATKHFSKPRPLYGLHLLRARELAPIIITEGEMAADAAGELLRAYIPITWPGGAHAWKFADFTPISNRNVLLWPDADEPGVAAMIGIGVHLLTLGCKVRIITPRDALCQGMDAADLVAARWSRMKTIYWCRERVKQFHPPNIPEDIPTPTFVKGPADPKPEFVGPPMPPKLKNALKTRAKLTLVGNTAVKPESLVEPQPELEQAVPEGTEAWIAAHFVRAYSEDWKYVNYLDRWYRWDTVRWERDLQGKINHLGAEFCKGAFYWVEFNSLPFKERKHLATEAYSRKVVSRARYDPAISATHTQWDTDKMLLGTPKGIIDLRTGDYVESKRETYITKAVKVAPYRGELPLWLDLLNHAALDDSDYMGYLQRAMGYTLCGETREECFFFLQGPPQSGKSTVVHVLEDLLGEYSKHSEIETFIEQRQQRHSTELARLESARMVGVTEVPEGCRWNDGRIKSLTGRDRITARMMAKDDVEFEFQAKIWIAANQVPNLKSADEAMRRRLHIIQFPKTIPHADRDEKLRDKLVREYPAILQWMIDGCLAWQVSGMRIPHEVRSATNEYIQGEDAIGSWLLECCEVHPDSTADTPLAYASFKAWADKYGEFVMSHKKFTMQLVAKGISTGRGAGGRRYLGFELKELPKVDDYRGGYDR